MKKQLALVLVVVLSSASALAGNCLKELDAARSSLLKFKDGGPKDPVITTQEAATKCVDATGNADAKKNRAVFMKKRAEIIKAVEKGDEETADKLATENAANLAKVKAALGGGD